MKQFNKLRTLIGIFIVVFTILNTSSCKKSPDCPRDLIVYGTVTPYDSVYHVGETLELVVKNSKRYIYSQRGEKYYQLNETIFQAGLRVSRIDSSFADYNHTLNFIEILDDNLFTYNKRYYIDELGDSSSSIAFSSINQKDSIYASLKIVLKEKGLYFLSYGVFNMAPIHCGISFQFQNNKECVPYDYDLTTRLNKGMDNNINLLLESPNPHFNTWMISSSDRFYTQRSGFAFRVID